MIARILGLSLSVQAIATSVADAAGEVTACDDQSAAHATPAAEETMLVVQAEGEGVPMLPPAPTTAPVRLGKGQEQGQQKEATAYLWDAANTMLGETHPYRTAWVRAYLEPLLSGPTDAVTTALAAAANDPTWTAPQRQAMRRTVGYYQRNRPYLHDANIWRGAGQSAPG